MNPFKRRRRAMGLFAIACMSFAMLIWLKLRLVTGVPRTAYADPEPQPPAPPASVNAAPR